MDSDHRSESSRGWERQPGRAAVHRYAAGICWLVLWAAWLAAATILTVFFSGTLVPTVVAALCLVGVLAARRFWRLAPGVALIACLGIIAFRTSLTPRNDRRWVSEYAALPAFTLEADRLTIADLRTFRWSSPTDAVASWQTRAYSLSNLRGLDVILEPFPATPLMAHTMLSFDFGPDGRLLLSIEARREAGETYGSIAGGLNQFELIYLFTDEPDALGLRALRGDHLYAFPAGVSPLKLRAFLLSLCSAAENLRTHPRFYKIIRDNCTTAWLAHSDTLDTNPIGLQLDSILPGRIARLMHERGVMDTDLPYDEAKERFRIDQRIGEFIDDPEFSQRIRERGE